MFMWLLQFPVLIFTVIVWVGAVFQVIVVTFGFPDMPSHKKSFLQTTVWIQPGAMGFIRAAAAPSGSVLPPLLVDVQQPSGGSQGRSQGRRLVGPGLSAPQSQPELGRRSLAAPSLCQIPRIRLWGWRRLQWGQWRLLHRGSTYSPHQLQHT